MQRKIWILTVACLLMAAGAWFFWPHAKRVAMKKFSAPMTAMVHPASSAPKHIFASAATNSIVAVKKNKFTYRLSNTAKTIGQLTSDRHAILLENALIDTGAKINLSIPKHLTASGDPGAFIVQAKGPANGAFRALLAQAGAQIVSYIPNDAYLVRLSESSADALAANALVQAVLPYEPYYKVESPLLDLAVNEKPLPAGQVLTLGLFSDGAAATVTQIEQLGGKIVGQDRSPFGPIVRVQPPENWLALVQLSGVQIVEPTRRRTVANDLTRVTVGVATNTVTGTNYLGLTGKNVIVEVNDTGIDATHPDFTTGGNPTTPGGAPIRVIGDAIQSLTDTNGHGTHVAGIISGNGAKSYSITNIPQGSVTNADFRGKAPLATLYSVGGIDGGNDTNQISDSYLQEMPARTNALISNNSWVNDGDLEYDLSAASYDAAVRDAIPEQTGPQPVLFVFAAGNDGSGDDGGGGGTPDSISSPGTAKNVITVGALESDRNITNAYTPLGTTNPVASWLPETDSSSEVAFYSSRGNVGIGTEGTYGRFKPDVVAPGSFIVSTRSSMWDQNAYYDPTNVYDNFAPDQVVDTNGLNYYSFSDFGFVVKGNAVNVSVQLNIVSPESTPTNLPIYVSLTDFPNPTDPTTYDFVTTKDNVTIPPDGPANYLGSIVNNFGDFNFAVGSTNSLPVTYDMTVQMVTTNDLGDYYTVLSNLNNTIGPYYRYESGTSMAAPAVSGTLALMQDFFTNILKTLPSPALLKAMLINGARPTGFYNFQVDNPINFEGWGLINLPNSLPSVLTNSVASPTNSFFFVDQTPTNTLATGDSRTYTISLSPIAQTLPLRITLAWTDPPGNPTAAIKLVNNLDLIVTNMDNPTNAVAYYGNDIAANQVFNTPENPTNSAGIADAINNVENVFLPANSGTNFTVVIYGTAVNVNAVTTQTNNLLGAFAPNISQDFALVISSGNGNNTNGFAITATTALSNPTNDQDITVITSTSPVPLLNQFVGAASPLLGTNTVGFGANSNYVAGALVTVGMTNQWHFYVVTNYGGSDFTNAAFITFLPPTAAIPREGVFADSDADSTRPEADIDLYVSTDPSLMNLNPSVIYNCVNGAQVGASTTGKIFFGTDLDRGGSDFVVDTNSAPGQVYYVGVKSEDQMASEYNFLVEFSNIPFSQTDPNGDQIVNFYPVNIPDGDATHPGFTNSIGLAIYPIQIQRVVVTNVLAQQNGGDLVISLSHSTVASGNGSVVLLNHDSPNSPGIYTNIYDDSGQGDIVNSRPSDGPGSLNSFVLQQGSGIWMLHVSDNAPGFIGGITNSSLFLQVHQGLVGTTNIVSVQPNSWSYNYVVVPVGYTNLTVFAVDETPGAPPYLTLAVKSGSVPTINNAVINADEQALLNIPSVAPPGLSNSISVGPPLSPGVYYVGIYNPSLTVTHTVELGATLGGPNASAITTVDYPSTDTPIPLLDDAVTTDSIFVTNADLIEGFNVGLRVDHPRISDLAFTLISPAGERYLLMENRGGYSTNGAGMTVMTTNSIADVTANGTTNANTNFVFVTQSTGVLPISWNFFTIADQMTIYDTTNNFTPANLIFDTGLTNGVGQTNLPYTTVSGALTIIVNQFGNPNGAGGDAWTYTAGGVQTNYYYLAFTEDTNLTTTPVKFAVPPFVPKTGSSQVYTDSFETYMVGTYTPVASFGGGWTVLTNQVIITNSPPAFDGINFLVLTTGAVSDSLPTIPGQKYRLQYALLGSATGGPPFPGLFAANFAGGADDGSIVEYPLPNTNATTLASSLAGPDALAFDSGGNLYAAYSSINQIWKFPAGGGTPSFFANSGIDPGGLTFDRNGNLYVANFGSGTSADGTIQIITPAPAKVSSIFATGLDGPVGLAFDGTGTNLYVAINNGNTIEMFSPVNTTGTIFASGLPFPEGLAFDSTGTNLYVANNNGRSVEEFQIPNTAPLPVISGLVNPTGLTFDNSGNLYVADAGDGLGLIYKLTSGGVLTGFTRSGLNNPQSLAFYNSVTGGSVSTNWQLQSVTFTAAQTNTPLVLDASGGGFAVNTIVSTNFLPTAQFDDFTLTQVPSDLYYQAEQSLAPIIGTSALGDWQLEVLDNRTGATNTAALVSWQLEFVFANTNATTSALGLLTGGVNAINTLAAASLGYYAVTVPPDASYATNLLLSADQPVNVWFSINVPPTINNPGDVDLMPNSTTNSALLSTNASPVNTTSAFITRGTTYYLVIQNLANTPVTFNVKVNFDTLFTAQSLHFSAAKLSAGHPQLQWSAAHGVRYQIQWANQITLPMVWNTITNPAAISSNGVSIFTDNGTQTAPLGPKRFYRLVKVQ